MLLARKSTLLLSINDDEAFVWFCCFARGGGGEENVSGTCHDSAHLDIEG